MDKNNRIIFRVPDEYLLLVKGATKEGSDTKFMRDVLDAFFNPEIREVRVEVAKEVVREIEVEKIVHISVDGEVRNELTIDLDPKVYEVFNSRKLSSMSMQDYANNYMWEKLEGSRKWFEQNGKNKAIVANSAVTQLTTTTSSNESRFDYWDRRIAECEEHDYDEQDEIRKGVAAEQAITEKQRKLLQMGGTRRHSK